MFVIFICHRFPSTKRGHRVHDRMVVGFTTTSAISTYHQSSCESIEPRSSRVVLDTTLCDQVCQSLVTGQWFSHGTPVSIYTADCHDITEILLKVLSNSIILYPNRCLLFLFARYEQWVWL